MTARISPSMSAWLVPPTPPNIRDEVLSDERFIRATSNSYPNARKMREAILDAVFAVPSVASALTLRQMVIDEPPDARPLMDFQLTSRGIQRGRNELLARLRAVVERNPE